MDAGTERRATGGIGWEESEGCGNRGEEQRQELGEVVGAMEARAVPGLEHGQEGEDEERQGRHGVEKGRQKREARKDRMGREGKEGLRRRGRRRTRIMRGRASRVVEPREEKWDGRGPESKGEREGKGQEEGWEQGKKPEESRKKK